MEPSHTTDAAPSSEENQIELQESVDLCFMLDCTGSMQSYINMARNRVQEVIVKVQQEYPKSQVRIGIVAYRDVQDSNRFEIFPFEDSPEKAKQFLARLGASGGGDTPEDINGAFQKTLFSMDWQNPVRLLVHIADAPCHGKDFHSADDSYPTGYKEDMDWDRIFRELVEKRLDYLFIKISQITDTMFEKFRAFAEKQGSLEAELSFQQEQIPNIPSSGLVCGMSAPAPVYSCSKASAPTSSIFGRFTASLARSFSGLFNAAPKKSSSELFCDDITNSASSPTPGLFSAESRDEGIMASEACFVENVTKNIKAGVYKQQQALAKMSAPK